jgi:protein-tyrosine phosphatase
MIDLHTHVLPGVDDGARSLDDSLAIARASSEDGVRVLAATPHVRSDYPTSADEMERLLGEVRGAVAAAGIELDVIRGGELALPEAARLDDAELKRFALGGGSTLLLEFPYYGWPLELEMLLFTLHTRGFRTLLAHPERNGEVAERPERLRPVVEAGTLVQVTAGSLDGRLGAAAHRTGLKLLDLGLAHVVATDAHAPEGPRTGLGTVAQAVGDRGLARWLTEDAPSAILSGEPLPAPQKRRRFSLRRG